MITRVSGVIRPKGSDLIFDHPSPCRIFAGRGRVGRSVVCVHMTQLWRTAAGPAGLHMVPGDLYPRRPGARDRPRRSPNRPSGSSRQVAAVKSGVALTAFAKMRRCGQGDELLYPGRVVVYRVTVRMYPPWPTRTALTSNSCPAPESMITSPASRSPGRTSSSTERDVTSWPRIARCHRHARPGRASPAPIAAAGCGRPGPAACAALSGGQPEVPGTGPRRRAGDGRRPWPRQRNRPGQAVPEGRRLRRPFGYCVDEQHRHRQ